MEKTVSDAGMGPTKKLNPYWKIKIDAELKRLLKLHRVRNEKNSKIVWDKNSDFAQRYCKKNRKRKGAFNQNIPTLDNYARLDCSTASIYVGSDPRPIDPPAKMLDAVDPIPKMFSWIPVTKNFVVDDEPFLNNIPYLGENEHEFLVELLGDYENTVHSSPSNKPLEDDIFLDLVEALKHYLIPGPSEQINEVTEETPSASRASLSKTKKLLPVTPSAPESEPNIPANLRGIFESFSSYFRHNVPPEDYYHWYTELCQKRDGVENGSVTCLKSIDSPDAESVTAEAALNSHSSLCCHRCFTYDCNLHKNQMVNFDPPRKKKYPNLNLSRTPCGPNCYMNIVGEGVKENGHGGPKGEDQVALSQAFKDPRGSNVSSDIDSFDETSNDSSTRYSMMDDAKRRKMNGNGNSGSGSKSETQSGYSSCSETIPVGRFSGRKTAANGEHLKSNNYQSRHYSEGLDESVMQELREMMPGLSLTEWSGSDQTLFRVLSKSFNQNWCLISRSIFSKTCRQVYEFSLVDKGHQELDSSNSQITPPKKKKQGKRQSLWKTQLQKKNREADKEEKAALSNYVPCYHPDTPCDESCHCTVGKGFCEKFCQCSLDCPNRFPGCNCKGQCNTKHCPCFLAVRECDPDLCIKCGSSGYPASNVQCKNVRIQCNLGKPLLIAQSDVAGWGVFTLVPASKNEFLSEYCGEIITQEEADRRGKVYDKHMCSFLFNLNLEYVVDATRKGNKIRFANHSINPNCYAKVIKVNGDHRIGIFAKKTIKAGEELFFDYRYDPTEQLKFVGIERYMEA